MSRPAVFFSTSALAVVLAAIALPTTTVLAADSSGLEDLGTLNNGSSSTATAISGDGSVVVGYSKDGANGDAYRAFRFTSSGGMTNLDVPAGRSGTFALGVSGDGTTVVGSSLVGSRYHAVTWTAAAGWTTLPDLNSGAYSEAYGANNTGSIIVGTGRDPNNSNAYTALRWDAGSVAGLAMLNGGSRAAARDVSDDGSVVVGYARDGSNADEQTAVQWDSHGTVTALGALNGGGASDAYAVTANGNVIVGYAKDGTNGNMNTAVKWAGGTVSSLGQLSGGLGSQAYAVTNDASVVVGKATDSGGQDRAFRWTASGMQTVEDWLRGNGVTIAADLTTEAKGVSSDGTVVVGKTETGTAFIARVVSGSGNSGSGTSNSGIIDLDQYSKTIINKPTTNVGLNYANTVLNGAHGEPMRNLLATGQQSIWVTADIGHDKSRLAEGNLGIGDFGYGYGFDGGITGRLAFGGIYTEQDLSTGGKFDARGFYIAPEASIALGTSDLYATIAGYYSAGRMNINRGYQNGGAMDYSHGEANTETWAAKLLLDWLNAASVEGFNFTPYASLSYAHSHMDGYTETGGSFPSRFNAVNDHSTVARLGVDVVREINEDVRLTARAEAAYRFEKQTAGTSGQIVGLSSFSHYGQDIDQLWARGSLGTEFDIAGGTASLSLNVTSRGDDPDVWLRTGWKVNF